jgi:hypothetical protein
MLSSGSIPFVMQGVKNIANAPDGTYRDGGVLDYHMNLAYQVAKDDIIFMPHFFDEIIPGWFDKQISWRKPNVEFMDNMVIVAPTAEFIATLPGRKVPDRDDFKFFFGKDKERFIQWEKVVERCRILGDELAEMFNTTSISVNPLFV